MDENFSILHIPSGREFEVFERASYQYPLVFHLSPDGSWLAFTYRHWDEEYNTLFVYEITNLEDELLATPILARELPSERVSGYVDWIKPAELSWVDDVGFWILDMNGPALEPQMAIAQSNIVYDVVEGSDTDRVWYEYQSYFTPGGWSPDWQSLIVLEHLDASYFRVIERDSNISAVIPESGMSHYGGSAIWLDEQTILHHKAFEFFRIYTFDPANDPTLVLEKEIPFAKADAGYDYHLVDGLVRFQGVTYFERIPTIFDLDRNTGEVMETPLSPDLQGRFFWSPDRRYALIAVPDWDSDSEWKSVNLLDTSNGSHQMIDDLSGKSCCFFWHLAESQE